MEYPQYKPASDNLPLSDEELMALDEQLADLPADAAFNIEALDGYLTGLLLSPQPLEQLPGADWLPTIWGGDGEGNRPFASGKQKKRVLMLVLRHLHSIACQIRSQPERWEPIFSVAETDSGEELTDAEDWCTGFMSALDLAPAAWAPLLADAEVAPLLRPMLLLSGDEPSLSDAQRDELAEPAARDALSRALPEAVLALWARRHPTPA